MAAGVRPGAILVDPAHDFGKNTWQSLELTRRLGELAGTGWPVLVAVADKDFIGETLALPVDQRAEGTIASLAICAWLGARVFRVHNVPAAREALAAVARLHASPTHRPRAKPSPRRASPVAAATSTMIMGRFGPWAPVLAHDHETVRPKAAKMMSAIRSAISSSGSWTSALIR